MFLLVIFIRPPKDQNLRIVQKEIAKIIYQQNSEDVYEIDISSSKKIKF
jgi:hypothetical protein